MLTLRCAASRPGAGKSKKQAEEAKRTARTCVGHFVRGMCAAGHGGYASDAGRRMQACPRVWGENPSMFNVLLCRALHPDAMAMLAARPDLKLTVLTQEFRGPPMQKELAVHISDAHAVMVGLERVSDDLLATAPHLRMISRFGVGYDSLDIPACTRRGV